MHCRALPGGTFTGDNPQDRPRPGGKLSSKKVLDVDSKMASGFLTSYPKSRLHRF
jgi:hypothetical protein